MTRLVFIVLLVLVAGCVPLVHGSGYVDESRHNVPEQVPSYIIAGRTEMKDVLLALGEPDGRAPDESWMVFTSVYTKGGVGGATVLAGGGTGGVAGAMIESVLTRRLVVHFDARGVVTSAAVEHKACPKLIGGIVAASGGGMGSDRTGSCLDVHGIDLAIAGTRTSLENARRRLEGSGQKPIGNVEAVRIWGSQDTGSVALTDSAVIFVPDAQNDGVAPAMRQFPYEEIASGRTSSEGGNGRGYFIVELRLRSGERFGFELVDVVPIRAWWETERIAARIQQRVEQAHRSERR